MSATNNADEGGSARMTETQFVDAVRAEGVVVVTHADEDDIELTTKGEGRQTRYFVDGEKAKKSAVVSVYETYVREQGAPVEDLAGGEAGADEIQCEYCGALVGYLTGSHMQSHDAGPQTVEEYRQEVASRRGVSPDEVPLAPDALAEAFEAAGQHDEETLEELSRMNKARWEAGEYDHLRADEDGDEDGA